MNHLFIKIKMNPCSPVMTGENQEKKKKHEIRRKRKNMKSGEKEKT